MAHNNHNENDKPTSSRQRITITSKMDSVGKKNIKSEINKRVSDTDNKTAQDVKQKHIVEFDKRSWRELEADKLSEKREIVIMSMYGWQAMLVLSGACDFVGSLTDTAYRGVVYIHVVDEEYTYSDIDFGGLYSELEELGITERKFGSFAKQLEKDAKKYSFAYPEVQTKFEAETRSKNLIPKEIAEQLAMFKLYCIGDLVSTYCVGDSEDMASGYIVGAFNLVDVVSANSDKACKLEESYYYDDEATHHYIIGGVVPLCAVSFVDEDVDKLGWRYVDNVNVLTGIDASKNGDSSNSSFMADVILEAGLKQAVTSDDSLSNADGDSNDNGQDDGLPELYRLYSVNSDIDFKLAYDDIALTHGQSIHGNHNKRISFNGIIGSSFKGSKLNKK